MEEETKTAETEQRDAANNEGEPSVDMPNNSPTKRGRGRPQGSKKLKVCVTDVNLMELVSGISNGGSTQPPRGRGRPKLSGTKHTEQQGSGDDHADDSVQTPTDQGRSKGSKKEASDEDSPMTDHSPKKRGRPKKSLSKSTLEKADAEDLPNGASDTPKPGRGRPKGSTKRKSESLTSGEENEGSPVIPRKRGRPKGSLNNTPRLEREVSSEGEAEADGSLNSLKRGRGRLRKVEVNNIGESTQETSNGISKTPRRGRGRPRKSIEQQSGDQQELVTDGSQPAKRGRGRPKGSLNKKVHGKVGRPRRVHVPPTRGKRGRPRKQPAKRGRPRKYPLPSPEELKRPKVWKPLGRPRKYPRVDSPVGAPPAPRRSRGRPRKSESKKGAHLRKSLPSSPSSPRNPNDGPPRKRGRPPSTAKSEEDAPRKRGRPKGSVNKNKARSETQLDSAPPNHSKSDSSAVGVEPDGEPVQEEAEHKTETMPIERRSDTEETLIDQNASFEVSNQA
ncbi:chromosomal protein D1-like [Siniperca chuatsi]|uniref:chromosomal protein D1-like n=1 Tax=Siniperca chuatsi TaxID=119488 RepID=UPI001CE1B934|nr:chromosomal protein D1-like [Siniperca chuatsi]XP_044028606.1 chromosomal protein D1-like [Siniperca chuatsi]